MAPKTVIQQRTTLKTVGPPSSASFSAVRAHFLVLLNDPGKYPFLHQPGQESSFLTYVDHICHVMSNANASDCPHLLVSPSPAAGGLPRPPAVQEVPAHGRGAVAEDGRDHCGGREVTTRSRRGREVTPRSSRGRNIIVPLCILKYFFRFVFFVFRFRAEPGREKQRCGRQS